jgi:molybdenum cofactor guanylyltransferase
MGGGKPLRMLGGIALLDRVVAQARDWSDAVAVAVREQRQLGELAAVEIFDVPDVAGPLAGLIAGAHYARSQGRDSLLTIPSDTPFLPDDLCERLQGALANKAAAIASSGGQLHPVCALWRVEAVLCDDDYLASGRRSLWGMAEHFGFVAVEWPVMPRDPFFNINVPEDLAEAEQMLRG